MEAIVKRKLVCYWNIEGGCRAGHLQYLKNLAQLPNLAAICLQEVHKAYDDEVPSVVYPVDPGSRGDNPIRTRLYQEIEEMLGPSWVGRFAPQLMGYLHDTEKTRHHVGYGQATFIRQSQNFQIMQALSQRIYGRLNQPNTESVGGKPASKIMIVTAIRAKRNVLIIANAHGFWSRHGKRDLPERNQQNANINKVLKAVVGNQFGQHHPSAKILLGGDFNYHSQMKAVEHLCQLPVFGEFGGVNLNCLHGITDTRTGFYAPEKPYREADFVIVSQSLHLLVRDFWVDNEVPSDHAALFVELAL